jgi:hypothetical protein
MLILKLAAFLLPLLLCTTAESVLGNSQSKELKVVYAKDLEGGVAVPRSNSNSVSQRDGMVPSGHFILFRKPFITIMHGPYLSWNDADCRAL